MPCAPTAQRLLKGPQGGDCVWVSAHNAQERAVGPTRVCHFSGKRTPDIQARQAESMCFHCKVVILREKWASDRLEENEAISFPYMFFLLFCHY